MTATKPLCPECAQLGALVSEQTIIHQLKRPWDVQFGKEDCFFCEQESCDTVYFSNQGLRFKTKSLRQQVGIKSRGDDALICYCFDVSRAEAIGDTQAKAYVSKQTKAGQCACKIRNPSGRCCLKDFSKIGEEKV